MTAKASRSLLIAASFTLMLTAQTLFLAGPVAADSATIVSAVLPSPRSWTSAAWVGDSAYVFGGADGSSLGEIVRYNPGTNTVTTMAASLPTPRVLMASATDGVNVYLLGGFGPGMLNEIVRYDAATDSVTVMPAVLPSARYDPSAVWDGTDVYVFGGWTGNAGRLNQIVRYNPATNVVTTMAAALPSPTEGATAVWDGTNAYIFGGYTGDDDPGAPSAQIVRYSPATDTVTMMSALLPSGRYYTSAVWDGTNAYVLGGHTGNSALNQIVRYNPSTNTVTTMGATLPTGRESTSAAWDGANAYIFGGVGGGALNQIVKFDPTDNTPPVIAPTLTGILGMNGWYRSATTLSWTVTDGDSAVTSSTGCASSTISEDTAGVTFTCTATSTGGTATKSVTVKKDETAPFVTGSRVPLANENGWNNESVTVSFACTDNLSGVESVSPDETLAAEGENQQSMGSCLDLAGNSGDTTVGGIHIDLTAPSANVAAPPASFGPYNVGWQGDDALSGLDNAAVEERAFHGLMNGTFAVVCAVDIFGSPTESGSCIREPPTGEYCYRIRVADLAGNAFVSLAADLADPAGLAASVSRPCTVKV